MSAITTHILDLASGKPAAGVAVTLQHERGGGWTELARGTTNADGRITDLLPMGAIESGRYRLVFDTGAYFAARRVSAFHPQVTVEFLVAEGATHYHVPLLISPFGYTTYRGS